MGSLGVVDGFETNYTLDVILKNDEFSWFFEIFICGSNYSNSEIGRYRPENHDLALEMSSLMLEPHYIQQVGGGADAGAPDLRTEWILSVGRNVFMAKNVWNFLET